MTLIVYDLQLPKRWRGKRASRCFSAEVGRPDCRASSLRSLRFWLKLLVILLMLTTCAVHAQASSPGVVTTPEAARVDRLEQLLQSVVDENRRLSEDVHQLREQLNQQTLVAPEPVSSSESSISKHDGLAVTDQQLPPSPQSWLAPQVTPQASVESPLSEFRVRYDNGFAIVPTNSEGTPFSLKINSQNMFRYSDFNRDETSWTDSAGNVNPIVDSSNYQIPRGRLLFSGNALLPDFTYLLSIDYNTVNSNPIGFRAYELAYRFNRAVEIHVGQAKVPGTREWIESAFSALEGPDRTMATTFFRPSLSQGVWFTGEPIDGVYYQAMMANGFNTLNTRPSQLNDRYCWSGSVWWEPWGDFGRGYADFEAHQEPVIRVGGSYTFALGQGSQSDGNAVENSLTRLSDGTLITQTGAFAPGVKLQSYDIALAAIDAAFKYRGLSLSTEWFAQDLSSLQGDGPLPLDSTQAYGGFVQGGYFIIPQTVELYSRTSFVTGEYGSGSEVSGGLNWFILPGQSNLRFTFDMARLESSPADQNRTGYVAGQTGLLIRSQIAVVY